MNTAPPPAPTALVRRRLWSHLWAWTLVALLLIWLTLAAMAYYTGVHEAEEITDGQLVSTAEMLLRQAPIHLDGKPPTGRHAAANNYAPELHVVAWAHQQVVWDTHGLAPQLPAALPAGHQTLNLTVDGRTGLWRAFVADDTSTTSPTDQHRIAVLVDQRHHAAQGRDIAEHIFRPALVLLPLVAWLLAWAIQRGLRPLDRLSHAITTLDIDAGQTLPAEQPFRELATTAEAINGLVDRLQAQWRRERRFTSDVAHELRTPLTALVWQARQARDTQDTPARHAALQRLESDALRAGRILTQLLDLARAQGPDAQPEQTLDLCALARQVVTEHVPLAHDTRHELALEAPDQPVWVPGRSAMLELALRNLVDNALRHTPAGTQVEVAVTLASDGSTTLSVSDDGPHQHGAQQASRPGMGIGLTLVQRIADAHHITLQTDGANAPYATRYALVWPSVTHQADTP